MAWTQILCPFHEERNPSAGYTETGSFNCFGCGRKGKLLELLKEVLKLNDESAAIRYKEITGQTVSDFSRATDWFPSGSLPGKARDYERGSELFPAWFRRQ